MQQVPAETDFIVVGAGVAGLRAAVALAEAGRVLVLAKQELTESATLFAVGGVAVALSDEDEIGLHLQDTIDAGDGIVNPDAARVLVEEGPERIHELLEWGTQFDRTGSKLTFTREGAHSRSRILHAHGDSTGREMGRALAAKAMTLPNISFCEFEFTADLILKDGSVAGVELIAEGGKRHNVQASSILLATGGAGQVFRDTTNPSVATADGVAMAYRAGAVVSDMEFVQFHPTALYVPGAPRFLLSEALRGEGAYLLNPDLQRFMPAIHPMAELAPRDVVARAIASEISRSTATDPVVYLDMRHLESTHIGKRFPRIYSTCLQYKIDITKDLVPIRPAAHYLMGGVKTDLYGHTNVRGLYAAGETACTGVHGANRLASNSLLEGVVYGARAGECMREELQSLTRNTVERDVESNAKDDPEKAEQAIRVIQNVMWRYAGVVRDGAGLQEAIVMISALRDRLPAPVSRRSCEARNIQQAASLIVRSAMARKESRGAHFRTDFPVHDDANFRKHSVMQTEKVSFE
ncbi:MAG: L-aspartate oxidase [Acidobacteriaceae bacterium]|nr:L-aspartate oxidase [Acidobacteriaceae bacterium]